MNTDQNQAKLWTIKLLTRMFDWVSSGNVVDSSVFAGSVKYGFATYEHCGIRIHRQTRLHSTGLMEERFGEAVRRGDLTWGQVMHRNGKWYEIDTPVGLVETTVEAVTHRVPLTDARRPFVNPKNVMFDQEIILSGLRLDDFVFVGDAREYRNLVTMALLSHV